MTGTEQVIMPAGTVLPGDRPPKERSAKRVVTNVIVAVLALSLLAFGFFINSAAVKPAEGTETPIISGAKVLLKIDLSEVFHFDVAQAAESEEGETPLVAPWYIVRITETQVNSWLVVALIALLCFWLTRDMKVTPEGKKQIIAEFLVEKATAMVHGNMSREFTNFAPFIAALISLSAFSSLSSLLGWYPPTAELNTIIGWSVIVFVLITYEKLRAGILEYLKGYTKPIFIMAPLNVIGEIATPLSMTFRHFGNVCSGLVISALLTKVLTALSNLIWNAIGVHGFFAQFAFFRVGIPAIFSLYFDIFSGCLQAFIFCMLTMINIYIAHEDSNETRREKAKKKAARLEKKRRKQAGPAKT